MTNEYATVETEKLDETEKLERFKKSFSKVRKEQNGFLREYALMQEAEALNISLDEYRRLYDLSLRKPTLISRFWKWTGFSDKKLWDYLQLLIVPVLLAIGGYYLNDLASKRTEAASDKRTKEDRTLADERYQHDQQIASDRYKQETLSNYLNEMTQLLLDRHIRQDSKDSEAWIIARARTITVLWKLDEDRESQYKGQLLQFLKESNLIATKQQAIRLNGANLKHADLSSADLKGTDLSNVDLRYAALQGAYLQGADLSGTRLDNANLIGAHLNKANLKQANLGNTKLKGADLTDTIQCHTILPNGTESNKDCNK